MQQAETIVLLLGLVAALVVIAQKINLPYPVVLVLAGLALSFVPRLPEVKLNPDIVFYFFLPPLIYPAALFTSWRDFRRNLRPILLLALGGTALGLLIGFIARWIHRHLDDPPVQITISLLTPLAAYLLAERIHVSGILAVVTAGIYLGWHGPTIVSSRFRLQAFAVWEMVVFLLNGFVFITIGLQLPGILRELRGESIGALIDDALLVSGAAVLVRIGWVSAATSLPRSLSKQVRERDPYPDWRNVAVVAWAGMRGVISLAAAFALPFVLPNGNPVPGRNYILFFP